MHPNCVFQDVWIICISTSFMHWLSDIMIKSEGYAQYRSLYGDQYTASQLAWRRALRNLLLTEISIANCAQFITWFSTASEHCCPWYSVVTVGHISSASLVPWSTLPRDASSPTESYNARRTPQKQGSGSVLLYKSHIVNNYLRKSFLTSGGHGSHTGGGKCDQFLKKKNPLRQSQGGAGPARRAKWSLHFVHNLCLVWPLFCDWLQNRKSRPKKTTTLPGLPRRYGRRSCFAHSSENSPCFSYISPKMVLESFPNLHHVVFLQSIGLELIISSWTASDFHSTLSLH